MPAQEQRLGVVGHLCRGGHVVREYAVLVGAGLRAYSATSSVPLLIDPAHHRLHNFGAVWIPAGQNACVSVS